MDPKQLDQLFGEAVALMDAGDLSGLERFLTANPMAAQERLTEPGPWLCDKFGGKLPDFFQKPYLLWFVAEDPVRAGRLPESSWTGDLALYLLLLFEVPPHPGPLPLRYHCAGEGGRWLIVFFGPAAPKPVPPDDHDVEPCCRAW